jgi:hypothetical protein
LITQLLYRHTNVKEAHFIVGGAYPAHFIDVSDKTKAEVIEILDNCIHGKHGTMLY